MRQTIHHVSLIALMLGCLATVCLGWPPPAVTDGRLYVRVNKGVACYDLRKDISDLAQKK